MLRGHSQAYWDRLIKRLGMLNPESHSKNALASMGIFSAPAFQRYPWRCGPMASTYLLRLENLSPAHFTPVTLSLSKSSLGHFGVKMDITAPGKDLLPHIPDPPGTGISVPICGLFSYKIPEGAPCSTKSAGPSPLLPLFIPYQAYSACRRKRFPHRLHRTAQFESVPHGPPAPECFHIPGTGLHVAAPFCAGMGGIPPWQAI